MAIFDILLNRPFGMLMYFLYGLVKNYAFALFFFAVIVQIILLPIALRNQKNQIKMAKIRPKEMAIRDKYAGRNDTVTQQKMNAEIMEMHKAENYSMMGGCLPMLLQLPVVVALFNIVRNPLTHISRLAPEVIDNIKLFIVQNKEMFEGFINNLESMTEENLKNIQQINIVEIFNKPELFGEIKKAVEGIPADFQNINYGFFGQSLISSPQHAGLSILLLIPVLNFAGSFLQTKLRKMLNANPAPDMANNQSMKIMEYTMPLLIVWMAYSWESALGLYWIYRSIVDIGQMFVLAKIYPMPTITEEDYELARQQYGGSVKKKKKKKSETETDAETDAELESNIEETTDIPALKDNDGGKYISKSIPKGINSTVKNHYQKTGTKYKFNKRKK